MKNSIQSVDRLHFERTLWNEGYSLIAGLDEVGRGCLAGPVVAAAVIFHPHSIPSGLKDSKQLSHAQRVHFSKEIKQTALAWVIREGSPRVIDEINILQASLRTMEQCVEALEPQPDYLLIDGNRYLPSLIPHQCVIKGDDRSATIAAASILAKVYRDTFMNELHTQYPHYGWDTNVGYATKKHYAGINEYGITDHHRKSFRLFGTKKTK